MAHTRLHWLCLAPAACDCSYVEKMFIAKPAILCHNKELFCQIFVLLCTDRILLGHFISFCLTSGLLGID